MGQDLGRFFDLSVDLMCLAGVDGFFKRVNPAFERVLRWTTEEVGGLSGSVYVVAHATVGGF
jgi:PAS domain S-box-containing protein